MPESMFPLLVFESYTSGTNIILNGVCALCCLCRKCTTFIHRGSPILSHFYHNPLEQCHTVHTAIKSAKNKDHKNEKSSADSLPKIEKAA